MNAIPTRRAGGRPLPVIRGAADIADLATGQRRRIRWDSDTGERTLQLLADDMLRGLVAGVPMARRLAPAGSYFHHETDLREVMAAEPT